MPGISALAQELMNREMTRDPEQFRVERSADRSEPGMSPHTLATLGGLADAASTYAFMKKGDRKEANPLVNMIANQQPELTALTALGGLLGTKLATKLIAKKWPKVADMIAANLGAEQLGLAAQNTANALNKHHQHPTDNAGFTAWDSALGRSQLKEAGRIHNNEY